MTLIKDWMMQVKKEVIRYCSREDTGETYNAPKI